jgi:transcriptional regulator with XRE-family HTH domain
MQDINFYPSMVKPLRTRLGMSQESLAYIVKCGVRSISHYETGKRAAINRACRENMIRLMLRNGITTEDLDKGES